MRRVVGWIGLLLWPAAAAAAPITIKGKVIGSDDGKPIPGAYVMINPAEPDVAKRTVLTVWKANSPSSAARKAPP